MVYAGIAIVLVALGGTLFFTGKGNSTIFGVMTAILGLIVGFYALALSIAD